MMLDVEKAKKILAAPSLPVHLARYQYLMVRLHQTDVVADAEFQAVYRSFYGMRRFYSDVFAQRYFRLMEDLKDAKCAGFPMIFERVKHIRCTYEMAFSSKMAHTIDPREPIWDSQVTKKHFKIKAPAPGCKDREQKCLGRYETYKEQFYRYMASPEGHELLRLFDQRFPNSGISDVKKIDFLLWQDR